MYATEVDPGDRVLIRLQAIAGRNFEGKVTRTSWTLDAKNRTLRTEIDVPNPRARSGRASTPTPPSSSRSIPNVLSVPTSALVRQDSNTFCVAVEGGQAVRKPVTVGLDDGTRVEILSGLRATKRSSRPMHRHWSTARTWKLWHPRTKWDRGRPREG